MSIKELFEKFQNAPVDKTLIKDLEISVQVIYVPKAPLIGEYIKLRDDTGELDAVAGKRMYDVLKLEAGSGKLIKFKGRLDKTEYGNIAFSIQEIVE